MHRHEPSLPSTDGIKTQTAAPVHDPEEPAGLHALAGRWGRSWVEVDLDAFRRNVSRVKTLLPPGVRLILSAKKDAYGHGVLPIVRAAGGVDALGLATVEEGLALRQAGVTLPMILFCVLEGEALAEAIRHDLTLSVTTRTDAEAAGRAAAALGLAARAHLKVDTGMGRLGRLPAEVHEEVAAILAQPHLRVEAAYSHLADGWSDPPSAQAQYQRLEALRAATGLGALPCHWGGSDALTLVKGWHTLAAGIRPGLRAGIALYGDHPALPGLEPVMTFKSRVIYRRRVPAGTAISYGSTVRVTRDTELALVGAGYGNGFLRALSGRTQLLIGGQRRPLLGRVCMDQVVVDVTDGPAVAVGDEAVIFGRQGEALLPAAEVAAQAGTISYELMCLAGQLNPRVYRGE